MIAGWASKLIGPKVLGGLLAAALVGSVVLLWRLDGVRESFRSAQTTVERLSASLQSKQAAVEELRADRERLQALAKERAQMREELSAQYRDARTKLEAAREATSGTKYSECRAVAVPDAINRVLRGIAAGSGNGDDSAGAPGSVHAADTDASVRNQDDRGSGDAADSDDGGTGELQPGQTPAAEVE